MRPSFQSEQSTTRYFITQSNQGLWQVFNSKNELQDSFTTKELAENYIKWLEEQLEIEKNEESCITHLDEQFLIRTKASLTWTGSTWQCTMPKGKWSLIFGIGDTPHEAVEACKKIIRACMSELKNLVE